ncbi:hypothetical protein GQ651_15745 [Alphaproteobacteria bacterium GH1-50]|uniref:Uncharacterized protein n=1 Tax=Kangsaoukella pontilimi TaxID=2691042 RepID=A0A7C9N2D3_9RHOB|nr:hypothetical protein [Kangsaoukella pontilimi]MXQ09298.1 hypothetical protein [Kangsaoukella pontilimi]
MTQEKPVVRLHLFFATENETAVILRQGPTRQFRLILWDRATDRFEDGQWLKQNVYVDRCDLSPDGRHFIFFALNGDWSGPGEGAYTVLSRPPYFTALALLPEGNTWGGGGRFLSNREYFAWGGKDIIGRAEGMERLLVLGQEQGKELGIYSVKGKRRPYDVSLLEKFPPPSHTAALDRYDTQGGVLSRRVGGNLVPIRDFNDMSFEPIRAPYDTRDDRQGWHPLDGEAGR